MKNLQIQFQRFIDYSRKFIVKPNLKTANINPETHFKILGFEEPLIPRRLLII